MFHMFRNVGLYLLSVVIKLIIICVAAAAAAAAEVAVAVVVVVSHGQINAACDLCLLRLLSGKYM